MVRIPWNYKEKLIIINGFSLFASDLTHLWNRVYDTKIRPKNFSIVTSNEQISYECLTQNFNNINTCLCAVPEFQEERGII